MTNDVSHREFSTRSLTRIEVIEKAEAFGWPAVTYRSFRVVEIKGERAWREAGLSDPAARRDAYTQLLKIGHSFQGDKANG